MCVLGGTKYSMGICKKIYTVYLCVFSRSNLLIMLFKSSLSLFILPDLLIFERNVLKISMISTGLAICISESLHYTF